MPGIIVDGNDVIAVHEAIQRAAKRARRGGGPSLIELITYSTRPHNERQSETRPPEEIEKWRRKDPVLSFREKLMKSGVLTKRIAEEINEQVRLEIEEAVRFAEASPAPEPGIAFEDLFAEN
jgi:pyruvate dehydrogenase E1 component alpha subunit